MSDEKALVSQSLVIFPDNFARSCQKQSKSSTNNHIDCFGICFDVTNNNRLVCSEEHCLQERSLHDFAGEFCTGI